ncbi:hypothetical protein [Gordonia asplenii]|uniref:hypothetical protein n=1 Tax=Gordonia asplenii TaxID=2725283 RepID=UPI0028AFC192|nr:hypothetical protein [Gordonia asplenii]
MRRAQGIELADRAEQLGADVAVVEPIRALLAQSADRRDRLTEARARLFSMIPGFVLSRRWVPVVTVTLLCTSGLATAIGLAQLLTGGIDVQTDRATVLLDPLGAADAIRLIGASITFTLVVVGLAGRRRRGAVWTMEMIRIGALVVTALNALVDFAAEGFGALVSVAIGLAAVAVLTHQINLRTT